MNTRLTPPPALGTIININPPAASRCGLNETGICCKESDTAHSTPPAKHAHRSTRADDAQPETTPSHPPARINHVAAPTKPFESQHEAQYETLSLLSPVR
jgi:hypothetical protein